MYLIFVSCSLNSAITDEQATQACRLLSTPRHPGGCSQGLAHTGELLLDATGHRDFFVDFLFGGQALTLFLSVVWNSVWSPSWSCPVVSLLAQPFNCCDYRLKWPDPAREHLCHGPLTRVCLYATHSPELKGSLHVPSHS